jgi:chromosome segregation ATPase
MGLFKKRSGDTEELTRLRSEIAAMSARLEANESAKAALGSQIDDLSTRLTEPPPPPKVPATPSEPPVTQADHDMLRARVQRLTEQLESAIEAGEEATDGGGEHTQIGSLQARLDALTDRLDAPLASPPPPPPPTLGAAEAPLDLTRVEDRIDELVARIDDVDARITSISTELANQISEMSGELDALGANETPSGEFVDELRDAQTRLANEQARYQIAFRQDLADLAERLKRA